MNLSNYRGLQQADLLVQAAVPTLVAVNARDSIDDALAFALISLGAVQLLSFLF